MIEEIRKEYKQMIDNDSSAPSELQLFHSIDELLFLCQNAYLFLGDTKFVLLSKNLTRKFFFLVYKYCLE